MSRIAPVIAFAAVGSLLVPATALASGDSGDPVEAVGLGRCTASSTWKLDVKEHDGGVEVEFEVESGVVGTPWKYAIKSSGRTLTSGTAVTQAPSGSFSVELTSAAAGSISATADNPGTGESCVTDVLSPVPGTGGSSDGRADDSSGDDGGKSGDRTGDTSGRSGHDDDSGDDSDEHKSGDCSAGSAWTLKVLHKGNGRVQLRWKVDDDASGQRWAYKIKRGKRIIARGVRKTGGSHGAFSVGHKFRSKAVKRITAVAHRLDDDDDERCTASVRA